MPDHHDYPLPADVALDPMAERVRLRLAMRRRALGLDPRLLDTVLNLRNGAIERLESGRARIRPSHLYRLAELFGVTVDWFFADADEAEGPASTVRKQPPGCPEPAAEANAAPAPVDDAEVEEARRFLVAYERLRDTAVRCEIRKLVRTLAQTPDE